MTMEDLKAREDINKLATQVADIKKEVTVDIAELKSRLSNVESKVTEVKEEQSSIKIVTDRLDEQILEIKNEKIKNTLNKIFQFSIIFILLVILIWFLTE